MRQVDRALVGVPLRLLQDDIEREIDKVRKGKKANHAIYAHSTVRACLEDLYLMKCYICERYLWCEASVVEHFQPWHQTCPERAYDSCNLHLACHNCNQAKTRKVYRDPATAGQPAVTLSLIDPSDIPKGQRLTDMITFGSTCLEARALMRNSLSVRNTARLLNEPKQHGPRQKHWDQLHVVLALFGCTDTWFEICELGTIEPRTWTGEEGKKRRLALRHADAIYESFLWEGAPFSVSMNIAIHRETGLTDKDFERMSRAYRDYKGLPPCAPPLP